jgi:uncharacterized protein
VIVDCDIRKWPDRPHWHFRARLLGRDRYGTWLGAAPPVAYTGPRGAGAWRHHFVCVVPDHAWWMATFNGWADPTTDVYVDIATPARWFGSRLTAIDLDLDVVRLRDGRTAMLDEDEFEDHRGRYDYPPHIVQGAERSARSVLAAVRQREEPFGRVGRHWLKALEATPAPSPARS